MHQVGAPSSGASTTVCQEPVVHLPRPLSRAAAHDGAELAAVIANRRPAYSFSFDDFHRGVTLAGGQGTRKQTSSEPTF
jgi:hypothetical protein